MKMYFDCTFTYHSGLNTGIQRVVRNIISRDHLCQEKYGVETASIISFNNHYYEIDRAFVLNAKPVTASIGQRIKTGFDRVRQGTLKLFSLDGLLFDGVVRAFDTVEWCLKKLFWVIKTLRVFRTIRVSGNKRIHFNKDDKLILVDAFWTYDIAKSIDKTKLPREQIYSLIYDLIPVNHPEFVEELTQPLFMKRLPELASRVKNFIGISNSVATELTEYLGKVLPKGNFNLDYFLLGSDFRPPKQSGTIPKRERYETIFEGEPVWLVVGTIEPRKNHAFILDVFDELWMQGKQDKLVIIGRIGWKCDHVIARMQHHPELDKKLFFFADASDEELLFAYRRSQGLIFASYVEGFGLPIVEAMASGLRVFCSEIPVFREVGAEYPEYFSLETKKPLVDLISKNKKDVPPKPKKWMTWDESADIFFEKLNS
jgi:glycosyltransferase involved in cell wall biosynthesis